MVAVVLVERDVVAFIFAGLAGSAVTLCLFGWLIGGHVDSLPWIWGSIGERQTAEALAGLDNSWACEHDIPRQTRVISMPSRVELAHTAARLELGLG